MDGGTIISAPAPWFLLGRGYIILFKLTPDFVAAWGAVPEALEGCFAGGVGTVMYVDYLSSDVGPYRELLFVPGMFSLGSKRYFSITRIYVSTQDSVVNGRNNWGIPKERADFEVARDGDSECIRVSRDGVFCAELHFRSCRCGMPVTTAVIPPGMRTLIHAHGGRTYLTTPGARGSLAPARLTRAITDESLFPDFTYGRILCSFSVPKFLMTFPKARIL